MKYRTLEHIDLVMFQTERFEGFSLRAMRDDPSYKIFKAVYFLHLLNINGSYGRKIVFNEEFKEFLSGELQVSDKTVDNWMRRLVRGNLIEKHEGIYRFSKNMKGVFKRVK